MNQTSFWGQLGNSFVPPKYGEYEYVDKADTTSFLRKFAVIVFLVIAAGYLFSVLGGAYGIKSGKAISDEDGYYYRVKNGQLQIDAPILVDDLSSGVYVNITDKVDYFDGGDNLTELIDKGYKDILLISRTNRVKVLDGSGTGFGYVMNYTDFDDMETTGWGADDQVSPSIDGKIIGVIVVAGIIFVVLYPFAVKICAVILFFIAKLFCMLFRLDTDSELLKTFCIYSFVPAQALTTVAYAVFILINGADFLQNGSSDPVYFAIQIAAAVLPLIMTLAAAFTVDS